MMMIPPDLSHAFTTKRLGNLSFNPKIVEDHVAFLIELHSSCQIWETSSCKLFNSAIFLLGINKQFVHFLAKQIAPRFGMKDQDQYEADMVVSHAFFDEEYPSTKDAEIAYLR